MERPFFRCLRFPRIGNRVSKEQRSEPQTVPAKALGRLFFFASFSLAGKEKEDGKELSFHIEIAQSEEFKGV